MQFIKTGAWIIDESFKFSPEERQQASTDLSIKLDVKIVELFLSDCERIIIFWLSIQEDTRTPGSNFETRLLDLQNHSKALHDALIEMPTDIAEIMNAESFCRKFDRRLEDITAELESNLIFLNALSAQCLDKLQLKRGVDRDHIKVLVRLIIEAYVRRFKKLPSVSKNDTSPLFAFLQKTVAKAIDEPIGFDLYREITRNIKGYKDALIIMGMVYPKKTNNPAFLYLKYVNIILSLLNLARRRASDDTKTRKNPAQTAQ